MPTNAQNVKGPWSSDEDSLLLNSLEEILQSAQQNKKSPQISWTAVARKGPLTEKEQNLIRRLQRKTTSYASIASKLPGRTPLQVKNFIYREKSKESDRIKSQMSISNIVNSINR
ncbi:36280_t:CDS:2 [Gigaspora margarita]|uniref:36280_t:CDS:1 n=1 Tax=Gigaspora margarita TaxID=4874 RepID=A0ABN7V525_GIGMA|nr:36280_t:CDS:2 [Gigaspora margarita]